MRLEGLIPVKAIQDDDRHWYVIPAELQAEFREMLEAATYDFGPGEDNQEAKYKAQENFIDKFNQYRTNGDLNNIQLYARLSQNENKI